MSQSNAEPTPVREPLHLALLPELERELSSLVLSGFQKTLALAGPTTLDIITQTVAAVQRCVTATLAPELCIYNTRLASTACLPDEVLCMIWELLCVEDRVKVSHVCSSWRSLAINAPRLWAELDFHSAVHNNPCFCSLCAPHAKVTSVPRWNPPSVTNRGIFRNVLARSGSLPLIIQVEFTLDDTPIEEILEISQSLEPHHRRIQDLSFVSQAPHDAADFFSRFASQLSNLRTLHCTAKDIGRRRQMNLLLPALPSAETVVVRTSLLDCTALQLPSLRRLHCRIMDEDDILSILAGCPKLEILTLDMNLWEGTSNESVSDSTIKSIYSRASRLRLQEVVLLYVDHVLERSLLAMFHRASLQRLWIYYDLRLPSPPQFTIFQDLEASVDLVVSADTAAEEYRISATDSSGRCRTVQCFIASETMMALWGCLSHGSVTTLTLPAETWSNTIKPTLPILPCVRSITFLFDEGQQYSLPELGVSDGPSPLLPGLAHLRFACSKDRDSLPDRPHVSVAAVAALVSSLRGSAPVDTLVFDNVELDGDRTKLAKLVRELTIKFMPSLACAY